MIYTYAIIDSNERIDDSIKGLEGTRVYNIPYLDIGIVASEVYPHSRVPVDTGYILRHEEIVERMMEGFTVLPFRFLTVFNRREDILSMMKGYYKDIKEELNRLRGKVEFGIKVIWPGDRMREGLTNNKTDTDIPDDSPGRRFIDERFERYKREMRFRKEADRYIGVIDSLFNSLAVEKRLERLRTENLLLDAYYLVEKERQGDFKEAFKRLRGTQSDLKYLFSGPWPPYNFINVNPKNAFGLHFSG